MRKNVFKWIIVLFVGFYICMVFMYIYGGERSTSRGVVNIANIDNDFKQVIDLFPEISDLLQGDFKYYCRKEPWWKSLIAVGKTTLREKDIIDLDLPFDCEFDHKSDHMFSYDFYYEFDYDQLSSGGIALSETGFEEDIKQIQYRLSFSKSVSRKNVFIDIFFDDQGTIVLFVKIIRTRELIDKNGNSI